VRSFIVLLFCLISPITSFAGEWRLALCHGQEATKDDLKYRNAIGLSASSVFSAIDPKAVTTMKVRQCVQEPDLACYADDTAIYCREESFSQLIRIAAWLAAERAFIFVSREGSPATLGVAPSLTWTDAYLLADADRYPDAGKLNRVANQVTEQRGLSADSLNAIYSLYLDIHRHINNNTEVDPDNAYLNVAIAVYRASLEYAFAFLLGHEAYHFNNNRCHIQSASIIKSKGIWSVIRGLQLKGGLYDTSNRLDTVELKADHCGYKWLQTVSEKTELGANKVLNTLARKAAIDLLASPLLIGLKGRLEKNIHSNVVPAVKVLPGYLYPQSRLALVSATLRLTEPKSPHVVKLCNEVSKAMVSIIQDAVTHYPDSSGIVPDEVLAELPAGVEKSWNGAPWSEKSHVCEIGE